MFKYVVIWSTLQKILSLRQASSCNIIMIRDRDFAIKLLRKLLKNFNIDSALHAIIRWENEREMRKCLQIQILLDSNSERHADRWNIVSNWMNTTQKQWKVINKVKFLTKNLSIWKIIAESCILTADMMYQVQAVKIWLQSFLLS